MSVQTHSSFSDTAMDHAQNPRHNEPLEHFNGHARITGPCGDTMEFWIQVEDEKIADIGFTTNGCASSLACGSITAEMALHKALPIASNIEQKDILNALGDFPESSEHCALLAMNTLHAACAEYVENKNLKRIKHKIIILSGKGGVGKSTVAVNYAVSLLQAGHRVGLLDIDLHGPSIPTMLGLEKAQLNQGPQGLLPVDWNGLKVMSIGFLMQNPDDAIIWRGPRKNSIIKQFLRNVDWGDLDFLIIDSPPGTGDELLSVCQMGGEIRGAVVVTTPQKVSAVDARKSVTFCRELKIPVLGIIENMNGFTCPRCGEITEILPSGAGRCISKEMKIFYLGSIPMDLRMARSADEGQAFIGLNPDDPAIKNIARIFNNITEESR
ncbi:MAG: hypothetical protein AUK31_03745 [Fibrobacteres bacterium CG2_30_45_31]|nr:MAG: hypothetical protein AUK31_03745 [Fibrobacteres bacterium CG2_30_45_31]